MKFEIVRVAIKDELATLSAPEADPLKIFDNIAKIIAAEMGTSVVA